GSQETEPPGVTGTSSWSSALVAPAHTCSARASASSLMSLRRTWDPYRASRAAIPGPMLPEPMTALILGILMSKLTCSRKMVGREEEGGEVSSRAARDGRACG